MDTQQDRMLLVEDEAALVFGLKKLLQSPVCLVDTASTLYEALTFIAANVYRVVISDLRLGSVNVLDGLAVIKAARERHPKCTIIAITAYGEEALDERVRVIGADYYFEKPVVLNKIKNILQGLGL